jgi:ATP-binding cassette, subfamily A (ABC1), member 3
MGCRTLPYWIGTFVFDYILFIVVSIFFFVFAAIFQINVVTSYMGHWLALILSMGLCLLTWSYLWSFVFNTAASAQKYFVNNKIIKKNR